MAIPNTVANGMISGVIGEISHYGPTRVTAAVISSADEKKNLFGRAYTYNDDSVESVQVGGDGAFAGIMINPKAYRIGEEYARNGTQGEFLTMGEINTEITAGVKRINAPVVFSPDDGSLSAKAKAEAGDLVIGYVSRHIESPESPHLCVLRLTEIPFTVAAKEGE
ncbi:structural cement protein Gp24 [Morganella morganii]|uniref:structural cement protein Gp24 n=1 Tax=Morganella morganii TaxID=582 RepID=UPI002367954F|nr:hypothetical protein [Morganella morganii]